MTAVTWLHLSDWHQKGKDFDRKFVRDKLIKDIKNRDAISEDLAKIDFIVFSGDIAFSGKQEEYQTAKKELFEPLLEACGLGATKLFIVPGNHDLDRDKIGLLSKPLLNPFESYEEANNWLFDKEKRLIAVKPFENFKKFVRKYTHQNNPDYANIFQHEIDGKRIALLGLNSAWMCGRRKNSKDEVDDKGVTIIGEPQILENLENISSADLKIVIMHHPFDYLADFECSQIESSIIGGCNLILRGHQHKATVNEIHGTYGDCIIIPAGACYDNRNYANAYNLVHLDLETGQGTVFLRCWNGRDKWREDVDSSTAGKFEFTVSGFQNISNKQLTKQSEKESKKIEVDGKNLPIIPHQIPPPPTNFKGREDEIRDILSNFEKGATITGLRGMGGVGKTALALVLADKLKSQFPDGQIFIEMRGTSTNPDIPPLKPEEAMAQVIRAYNPVDRLPENSVELRGLYLKILAGKRALLLLDNAANSEQVYPLLPPEGCSVLITSRIKFALWGLVEQDLDILPPDKARELLLEIAPRIGDWAGELAKLCGYLPIALRNAASALAEKKDLSVPEYQRRLKDKVTLLKLVKGSFSLSYDLLTPRRKKQWRRLSVFPEDFDRNAATAVLKMDSGASAEALSDLVQWSLVDFAEVPDSEDGRYKLHDLARLFAESCLDGDELADAQQKHAKYYSKALAQAENFYRKGGTNLLAGLKFFDREWANIKVGQAWAKNIIQGPSKLKKNDLKSVLQLASSYAVDGGNVLDLRQHPRDKISWLETGLKAAKMMGNRSAESAHLGNLGLAYADLGETRKAIGYQERALNISRKISDRRGEGTCLSNLGNGYSDLGETRKAIEYYEQALAIAREIGDRRGEGARLGNLGNAYANLGETHKAIEYHDQALAISREIGDRRHEGSDLCGLGNAYADLGETRKAIEYYEQALKISREIGDRRSEGANLDSLGRAYADLGETRKAIEYYEQALKISHEIGDRRNEGANLGNLGLAYAALDETNKAIDYHEQSLAIVREIGDKRNEGECFCNLGKAYSDLNETDKAIEYCTKSLDLVRKIEYRKIEGEALSTLGKAYFDLGELDKTIDHCDQALKIFKTMEYRRGEGESLFTKSLALDKLGQRTEAAALANEALQIFQQIESPQAEKVRRKLAEWGCSPEEN